MHATMRDEREIATGDKTALQSPASLNCVPKLGRI